MRFSESDQSDVRVLAETGLIGPADLLARANEALAYYIGATDVGKLNIRDAVAMVQGIEQQRGLAKDKDRTGHDPADT